MNRNTVRWIIAALMLIALTLGLSYPSLAEDGKLPLDYRMGGYPPVQGGWTWTYEDEEGTQRTSGRYEEKAKKTLTGAEYSDPTISVSLTRGTVKHDVKGGKKNQDHEYFIVRVKINDVSQLRTAASNDEYKGSGAISEEMASDKLAVVAMNGDYFKGGNRDAGYLVRQGELIRDNTGNKRKRIFDMLLIDSEGDFHVIPSATTENINAFVKETLEPQGRTILDTFNLGPALIVNGEVQETKNSEAARQGEYQWCYPQQRVAIAQIGPLEYAIIEVYGKTNSSFGMTTQEFAEFIAEYCPDVKTAYNLDGGGSSRVICSEYSNPKNETFASYEELYGDYADGLSKKEMSNLRRMRNQLVTSTRVCVTPGGNRDIHDLIYFASAYNSLQQ